MKDQQDRIVLANVDYQRHMTDEGDQFQEGLRAAGWHLCGVGYCGRRDARDILRDHAPEMVVIHDRRDWDPLSPICFRKDIGFSHLWHLADDGVPVACVVKDAGSSIDYHRQFCEEAGAFAAITYYHDASVLPLSPWLTGYTRVRTYHTIDAKLALSVPMGGQRKRAVVTGARSNVYPLRKRVFQHGRAHGIDVVPHPGYGNAGASTPAYLRLLAGYKVHVATASRYGFALRKIIESVAMGCTPVTDLPEHDVLPEIDGALVRVRASDGLQGVLDAVEMADSAWNPSDAAEWARKASHRYDYRVQGCALSDLLGSTK